MKKSFKEQRKDMIKNLNEIMNYVRENHITQENYIGYERNLRSFFSSSSEYSLFIEKYLMDVYQIYIDDFLPPDQWIDTFPYVMHQQDSVHLHDYYNIKYMKTGNATLFIDNQTVVLRQSDFCFIHPYARQQIFLQDNGCMILNIVIRPEYISRLFPHILQENTPLRSFFLPAGQPTGYEPDYLIYHTEQNKDIERSLVSMNQYFRFHRSSSSMDLPYEIELERILALLVVKYSPEIPVPSKIAQSEEICLILHFIQENIEDITLKKTAEIFHKSEAALSRYIYYYTQKTFTQLLQTLRITKAAELLEKTDLNIDVIMARTGYSGKANFYRLFRQHFHETPYEYRKKKVGGCPPSQNHSL